MGQLKKNRRKILVKVAEKNEIEKSKSE